MTRRTPSQAHRHPLLSLSRHCGVPLARIAATALVGGLLAPAMVRFSAACELGEEHSDIHLSAQSQQFIRDTYDDQRKTVRFYAAYLKNIARGDFGMSRSLGRPIRELFSERFPETASLMGAGIVAAWIAAAALALPPLVWRIPALSSVGAVLSGAAAAVPGAAVAIVLFRLGGSAIWIVAAILFPKLYQFLHNLMRQAYGRPHVLYARAKGVASFRVLLLHALPLARAQLLALAAVSINMAFGAAVAVEAICDLPGIGQLAWKAALSRDLPVLVTLTLGVAVLSQLSNLVADLCSPLDRGNA